MNINKAPNSAGTTSPALVHVTTSRPNGQKRKVCFLSTIQLGTTCSWPHLFSGRLMILSALTFLLLNIPTKAIENKSSARKMILSFDTLRPVAKF